MLTDLKVYAERVEAELPPPFHRARMVRWLIHLDAGQEPSIDPAGDGKGVEKHVPMIQRSGIGSAAMLLVDSAEYVLAVPRDEEAKSTAGAAAKHASFAALVHRLAQDEPDDDTAAAVAAFLLGDGIGRMRASLLAQGGKASDVVGFVVDGADAHASLAARRFWIGQATERKGAAAQAQCLVCLEHGPLLESLPVLIPGAAIPVVDSSGAPARGSDTQLVSINNLAQARAGKQQLANTPICPRCGTLAIAGLTHLLSRDGSRRRGRDSVLIWWYTGESTGIDPIGEVEYPDPKTVEAMIAQVDWPLYEFSRGPDVSTFHAVTLSARKSRVVVHDHFTVPIPRLERTLGRWFQDTEAGTEYERYHPRLRALLNAAGRWDTQRQRYVPDSEPLGLDRALLDCALHAARPPVWLLPHLLTRITRDGHLSADRAALLRLCLCRAPAAPPPETLMPHLDPEDTDRAYLAGRLLAVLEAIQIAAIPEIRTPLSERYRSTARNPIILAGLVNNARVHLGRLRTDGKKPAAIALEGRLEEVLDLLDHRTALPAAHTLAEQGRFQIGFYQQRAADRAARRSAAEARNSDANNTGTGTE